MSADVFWILAAGTVSITLGTWVSLQPNFGSSFGPPVLGVGLACLLLGIAVVLIRRYRRR